MGAEFSRGLYLEEFLGPLKIASAMHCIHSVYSKTLVCALWMDISRLRKSIICGCTCSADAIRSVTSLRSPCQGKLLNVFLF